MNECVSQLQVIVDQMCGDKTPIETVDELIADRHAKVVHENEREEKLEWLLTTESSLISVGRKLMMDELYDRSL